MSFSRGRNLLVILALCLFVLPFQNCTKTTFENKNDKPGQKNSGGNYDGKVFVLIDPQNACVDGSHIVVQITEHPTAYVLDRDKCATVPGGRVLASSEVSPSPTQPGAIIYQGQSLVQTAAPVFRMACYSNGTNPSMRVNAFYSELNGYLQGDFEVTDLQKQQSYQYSILIKDVVLPVTDSVRILADNGTEQFVLGERGPIGIAKITVQDPATPPNTDEVTCKPF